MTIFALIFVQFLFGSLPVATKIALQNASPFELMILRTGGALLVFYFWWKKTQAQSPHITPRNPIYTPTSHGLMTKHAGLFSMALCGASLNQYALFLGLVYGGALIPAIVVPTIPLFTVIVAVLFGQERFHLGKAAAAVIGLGGVAVLALPGALNASAESSPDPLRGTAFCVLSSLLTAFFFVMKRKMARHVSAVDILLPVYGYGFSICICIWLFTGPENANPSLYADVLEFGIDSLTALPRAFWVAISFIVIGCTIVSNVLNTWAIRSLPASTVTGFIFLQTLVGMALGALILEEKITLRHGLAAGIIAFSLSLLTRIAWSESRKNRNHEGSGLTITGSKKNEGSL